MREGKLTPFAKLKDIFSFFDSDYNFSIFASQLGERRELIKRQKGISYKGKRILAVYDLIELPYTCDIATFIINAEVERRALGFEKIDIVIVGNDHIPANPSYEKRINKGNYKHIVDNILLEYTKLFDVIGAIIYFDNRNQIIDFLDSFADKYCVYPFDYDPNQPFERLAGHSRGLTFHSYNFSQFSQRDSSYNCLRPTRENVELARKWIRRHVYPKIAITITLRETSVDSARGSNISEWQRLVDEFAKTEDDIIFIIIRDYYSLYDDDPIVGENVIYCNEAVLSMGFRAALHQEVSLNLFVNNGVNVVSIFSQLCHYIMFKVHTPGVGSASYKVLEETVNLKPGDHWHGNTKYQKYVWQDDRAEVLISETQNMITLLRNDGKHLPVFYGLDDIVQCCESEPLKTLDSISNQPKSRIRTRSSISIYIRVYNFVKVYRHLCYWASMLPIFKKIKSIQDIRLEAHSKVVLYGAGTVAQEIISMFKNNIVYIVDMNATNETPNVDGIRVLPLDHLETEEFDYVVVTPKYREYEITQRLRDEYHVPLHKILTAKKGAIRRPVL